MKPDDLIALLGAFGILLTSVGAYYKTRSDARRVEIQSQTDAATSRVKLDEERNSLTISTLKAANETIDILNARLRTGENQRSELEKKLNDCEDRVNKLEAENAQKTRPRSRRTLE